MRVHTKLSVIIATLLMLACKDKKTATRIEVSGELNNLEGVMAQYPGIFASDSIKIILLEVPFGGDAQPIKLDSTYVTRSNPKFTVDAQTSKQSLYDIMIENGPMIPVVNDREKITVNVDLLNRESFYTTSGSPASSELHDFIFSYSSRSMPAADAFRTLDSLKVIGANDSLVIAATGAKNRSLDDLNGFLRTTLSKTENPIVSAFVLGMASRTLSPSEYDSSLSQAVSRFPTDPNLQYLRNQAAGAEQQSAQGQTTWVGKPAPELTMPDVNGKEVSLSSFKGKFVLVDFWASWCGPCRMENPNVVKAYNAFKNKNFTILGVSLDKEKAPWLDAIKKDQLTWTHISDLAFWNSKSVEIFQFQGIPYNVLVDPQGMIVAESLRGEGLMNKLKELVK